MRPEWPRTSPSGDAFDEFLGSFGADRTAGSAAERNSSAIDAEIYEHSAALDCRCIHPPAWNEQPVHGGVAGDDGIVRPTPRSNGIPVSIFSMVSPVAMMWCVEHSNYSVVPRLMEAKRVAIANDTDSQRIMYDRYLPQPPTMNLSDVKLSVEENMVLARAWIGLERWKDALDILESFPSWPVAITDSSKPWMKGTIPGLPSDPAALCRRKLGLPEPEPANPKLFHSC